MENISEKVKTCYDFEQKVSDLSIDNKVEKLKDDAVSDWRLDLKDKFGATKALREAINAKYDIVKILGKGSYG